MEVFVFTYAYSFSMIFPDVEILSVCLKTFRTCTSNKFYLSAKFTTQSLSQDAQSLKNIPKTLTVLKE